MWLISFVYDVAKEIVIELAKKFIHGSREDRKKPLTEEDVWRIVAERLLALQALQPDRITVEPRITILITEEVFALAEKHPDLDVFNHVIRGPAYRRFPSRRKKIYDSREKLIARVQELHERITQIETEETELIETSEPISLEVIAEDSNENLPEPGAEGRLTPSEPLQTLKDDVVVAEPVVPLDSNIAAPQMSPTASSEETHETQEPVQSETVDAVSNIPIGEDEPETEQERLKERITKFRHKVAGLKRKRDD